MSISEELDKLQQLRQSGALSEEEFAKAKASLLNGGSSGTTSGGPGLSSIPPIATEANPQTVRQWCMFVHLSIFAGYVIPVVGLVAPIILWQMKKAEMPAIDEHGKIVVNWIISAIIYFFVGFLLTFIFIGFFVLCALGIVSIVFPIIGGIKANNGEAWKYPLTIGFIK
jgi:uncharacterized Tic20 family protein